MYELCPTIQNLIEIQQKVFFEEDKSMHNQSSVDDAVSKGYFARSCQGCCCLICLSSCKNSGTRASVAMMHYAEKRQKRNPAQMWGIKSIEMAVKKAAEPSIKDDTLATLPFSFMFLPMSIAITVPMMLQGPPMQLPIKNMAVQYCQVMSERAKDTMNIKMELRRRRGLKKRALLLKRSTRNPTAVPPNRVPKSTMLEMQPFSYSRLPPLLSKKVGSHSIRPQMHPFRQEQPSTYSGTRGRHKTEKMPYFNFSPSYAHCSSIGCSLVVLFLCSAASSQLSTDYTYCLFSCSLSGFSFKKASIRKATHTANPPVSTKLPAHEIWCVSRRLQRPEAMMLPTLAFMAHSPIRTPFLLFQNQLLKMPIMPGHPVAWKNPLKHIRTAIRASEKYPVIAHISGNSIQLALASSSPTIMQAFSDTRCMMLPKAAIPIEQDNKQSASTMPKNSLVTPNSLTNCPFEQDHPSRNECRLAQPKKVSRKAVRRSQKLAEQLSIS